MTYYFLTLLPYFIPAILVILPLLLFFDIHLKQYHSRPLPPPRPEKPDISRLEQRLKALLNNNQLSAKLTDLNKELQKTPTNILAGYLTINKYSLKGFHLFQLIFTLIKNQVPDKKIVKIMHRYLPSSSEEHLYTILRSCKLFLKISYQDNKQKELLKDLNQNNLMTTLKYLENKLNKILSEKYPPNMQPIFVEEAVKIGLIFSSFSEFYDSETTVKVLDLCKRLSPNFFKYWHDRTLSPPSFHKISSNINI